MSADEKDRTQGRRLNDARKNWSNLWRLGEQIKFRLCSEVHSSLAGAEPLDAVKYVLEDNLRQIICYRLENSAESKDLFRVLESGFVEMDWTPFFRQIRSNT